MNLTVSSSVQSAATGVTQERRRKWILPGVVSHRRHRVRRRFGWLLGSGVFVLLALSARAEMAFTADSAVRLALEENPELQAAQYLIAEAEGRARSAGRLSNPELEIEVAGRQRWEGRVSVGFMQRFPLTSRLRVERNLSELEIEIARAEIRNKERLLGTAVRSAFYQLAFARTAVTLGRRQAELAASFADSLSDGIREGFGSALDGQQAALSASILKSRIELLSVDEVAALGRLNSLLGRPADAALAIKESLDLPDAMPAWRVIGERPDLQLADLMARAGEADISLAKASRWDDLGVGLFVEGERFQERPGGIESEGLIGVRVSIPLPLWQNVPGKVAEKNAVHARRIQELAAFRFAVRNEVMIAHRILEIRYQAAREMQDKLMPSARQQAADAEATYLRGELDIENVFQIRERFVDTEQAALEARKNYFLSYAEWLGALGEIKELP